MMVVFPNGSINRSTGSVAAVMSGLNDAPSHGDSSPKEDLDNAVLEDQLLHHPGPRKQNGLSGMGNSPFKNLRNSSHLSLSQVVDLTPHTEWESRKKNKGCAITKNEETFAEAGDGKGDRPVEKKARVASLWKAVKKEVMGSSVIVHQSESELRVKNKNHLASPRRISSPAGLNNAEFFPKGGDESAERSSEKKARTSALWKAVKKELEPESRKKNKTNLISRASDTVQVRPKEGDENTEHPSEKKARSASSLWKIVKNDTMGSSAVHQTESEPRRENEADQASEVNTEIAATAESGSKDDGEQADRPLEKKVRASALWNKVMKKEIMGSGVNKQQVFNNAEASLNNSSRGGSSSSNQSLMKKARKQSSARDLTQPEENRINTAECLEETKSQPREDEKRAITKSKRFINPRLLLKKALSASSINQWSALPVENEDRGIADGNIIEPDNILASESKSYEGPQSQAKEVIESIVSGDDGEEGTVGDSRLAGKSPEKKHLVVRRRSRSNPRRGRRSQYRQSTSDPSFLPEYDQPRDTTEDKHRPLRDEYSRGEAVLAYSSRDPAKRSEKQHTKRGERSPRTKGRRSQLRKWVSDPALAGPDSTSWESSETFEETKSQPREDEKRAITKSKRFDRRLLLKKAVSVPSVENEDRDFADGNIIESESKSHEGLQKSQANEVEYVKSPEKHLVKRRSTSRSTPRRGRRSDYQKSSSEPSLLTEYDQRGDTTEDKYRPCREEDSREEAVANSTRDPAKRPEKQQTKREERSPTRKGRRSQLRKWVSDPALAGANSTSWKMEKESCPLRDGDATREVKQYGARDVSRKRPSKQLRKGREEGRQPSRIPTSRRRSRSRPRLRRTASDPSSKEVTSMEKLEILLSGHNSTTAIDIFSQVLAPPLFPSLDSSLSPNKTADERRRKPSFDDKSLDEDSTICSDMSSEMQECIGEAPLANQGRIDDLATDAAAVLHWDDFIQDNLSVDEAGSINSM